MTHDPYWLSDYMPPRWVWVLAAFLAGAFIGALVAAQPDHNARTAAYELSRENSQLRADTALYGTTWRWTHPEYATARRIWLDGAYTKAIGK